MCCTKDIKIIHNLSPLNRNLFISVYKQYLHLYKKITVSLYNTYRQLINSFFLLVDVKFLTKSNSNLIQKKENTHG